MTHAKTFTVAAIALLGLLVSEYSAAQTVRCTTWNLEWFPNGSAKEASVAQQEQRIKEAADVLRPINPDIILLQECGITTHVIRCVRSIAHHESHSGRRCQKQVDAR